MKLFEAIIQTNGRLSGGDKNPGLRPEEFADSLPVVALTCIDPRLNRLLPEVLGVPEEQFIWLRNAGNIITGPLSSTMRSLALACAVKGGKEITVIGHSDCLVCKTTMMGLTEGFRKLGVERSRLPENLNEYFGLFASERQNVIRGADIIRQSPLIGANVPVHGLLLDIQTGKLEWLVNGYQTLGTPAASFAEAFKQTATESLMQTATQALGLVSAKLPEFKIGEMKLPEIKIGELTIDPGKWLSQVDVIGAQSTPMPHVEATQKSPSEFEQKFDKARKYKVTGLDQKVYGPIGGLKILEWIADGRIGWQTPAQMEGSTEWKPLSAWAEGPNPPPTPLPPPLKPHPHLQKARRR
jgi:carbonic anhydrase